ncbi:uncharacterized protein LOC135348176 isoform X2 [Halichondria panicea]
MEPIITSKLPKERFSKSCYVCEEAGMETQAVHGACMSCHKSSCRLAFHVTCAQREELLCEEQDSRDTRSILYCGYCSPHFKKMARQKYKQTLRKPMVTTPTMTTPPYPLSDLSPTCGSAPLLVAPHPYALTGLTPHEGVDTGRIKKEKLPMSDHTGPLHKRPPIDLSHLTPAKRKRRRKVSSSNESTTSEALSYVSDPQVLSRDAVSASPRLPEEPVKAVGVSERTAYSPVTCAQVNLSGSVENVVRLTSSSTSSEQSLASRSAGAAPPRSLQELLERQWEQTAQFILDKVGKQNNVGSMLAHLHTLQSENRQMQSKIMELASQREFYIAINTKLRQTLVEQDTTNRLPNGIRDEPRIGSPEMPVASPRHRAASKRNGNAKNRSTRTEPPDVHTHPHGNEMIIPNTLSKEVQDSLLKAHFQPPTSSLFTEFGGQDPYHRGHPKPVYNHASIEGNDRKITIPSSKGSSRRSYVPKSPVVASEQVEGIHEITRVTNSVQAPISAFAPLPSHNAVQDGGGVGGRGMDNVR